jgi:hypothetical protein
MRNTDESPMRARASGVGRPRRASLLAGLVHERSEWTPQPRVSPFLFPNKPCGVLACGIRLSVYDLHPGRVARFIKSLGNVRGNPFILPQGLCRFCSRATSLPVTPFGAPTADVGTFLSTRRPVSRASARGSNSFDSGFVHGRSGVRSVVVMPWQDA